MAALEPQACPNCGDTYADLAEHISSNRKGCGAAVALRYLAHVGEWSARLDRFCAELEAEGFDVKRDGWSVTIDVRPRPRREAGQWPS